MGQLDAFKSEIKFSFSKLSKVKTKTNFFTNPRYDYYYMFQKYGLNSQSFLEWILNKMQPTGRESVLDYSYFKHLLQDEEKLYFNSFKEVYVTSLAKNFIETNLKLINCCSNVKMVLSNQLKLAVSANSFDYIYVNYRQSSLTNEQKNVLMREFLRILKSDGDLYVTTLAKDYYLSIYELFQEYDLEVLDLSFCNEAIVFDYLDNIFERVDLETYESKLWITNADDLISYILFDPELSYFSSLISTQGISKLRHSLNQRIERDGGILIPYRVNVVKASHKIQLKLV